MKEIKSLTSFRAFAAFLVFMYHYAYLYSPVVRGVTSQAEFIPFMPLWHVGQVGVSLFFVLSGFLITRIYFDTLVSHRVTLRLFFVKRIARIWPLFLVYTIIQHGAMLLQGSRPAAEWLVTLSMTQGFFQQLRYKGLATAWSLTIEETFYALAPVVYLIIHRWVFLGRPGLPVWTVRKLLRFAVVLVLLIGGFVVCGGVLIQLSRWLGLSFGGFMAGWGHVMHSTICGRFTEFAIGIACAFVHRQGVLSTLLRGRRAAALAVAAFLGIVASMYLKDFAISLHSAGLKLVASYLIAGLTGVFILALSVEGTWVARAMSGRLLVYLGKISYGFYLLQSPVLMQPLLDLTAQFGILRLPVQYVLMNLFCAASYELVEKPARRVVVSRWAQSRSNRQE